MLLCSIHEFDFPQHWVSQYEAHLPKPYWSKKPDTKLSHVISPTLVTPSTAASCCLFLGKGQILMPSPKPLLKQVHKTVLNFESPPDSYTHTHFQDDQSAKGRQIIHSYFKENYAHINHNCSCNIRSNAKKFSCNYFLQELP